MTHIEGDVIGNETRARHRIVNIFFQFGYLGNFLGIYECSCIRASAPSLTTLPNWFRITSSERDVSLISDQNSTGDNSNHE
jgi:hypothetical protein